MISDDAECFFNRHTLEMSQDPIFGIMRLSVDTTDEQWDVMKWGEFLGRAVKARMRGVEILDIGGEDTHHFYRFLISVLPDLATMFRVRITVDGCRTLFIEKLLRLTQGFCVDIRLPLQGSYSQQDRDFCRLVLGIYRNPPAYRDAVERTIRITDDLPLTIFRVRNVKLMGSFMKESMKEFLADVKSPKVWDDSSNG